MPPDRDLYWYLDRRHRQKVRSFDPKTFEPEKIDRENTTSLAEVIAFRRRVTGEDAFIWLDFADQAEVQRIYQKLLQQEPRRGDWGYLYVGALARNRGDIKAADAEMLRAFGRTVSRSYARQLRARWVIEEDQRRAEMEEFIAAHADDFAAVRAAYRAAQDRLDGPE